METNRDYEAVAKFESFSPLAGIKCVETGEPFALKEVLTNVSVPLRGLSAWKLLDFPSL